MANLIEQKTYALFANPANRRLIAALEAGGADVVQIPPVKVIRINSSEVNNLSPFNWIIFPDVLTVEYFLKMMKANDVDIFELDELSVLACGEAVADRLRFAQLHADLIPKKNDAATIFSALERYLEKREFKSLNFLLCKERNFRSELKQKLLDKNANVFETVVYQLEIADKKEVGRLKALLKGGAIDEIVITAANDMIFLKQFFEPDNISEILAEIKISGIDEVTMQTLRENSIQPRFFKSRA